MTWLKKYEKLVIIIVIVLIVILSNIIYKSAKQFYINQLSAKMDMETIADMFNMWNDESEKKPNNVLLYINYVAKSISGQEMRFRDYNPQFSLLPTEEKPTGHQSTQECIDVFNKNLLPGGKYREYGEEIDFNKPLTVDEIMNNPEEVAKMLNRVYEASKSSEYRSCIDITIGFSSVITPCIILDEQFIKQPSIINVLFAFFTRLLCPASFVKAATRHILTVFSDESL